MTRHGPLTSQALGRSPYDIVVQGDGQVDPRAPEQSFDERGRPVNAETKRINRDIVRSHNEVMQVIGVAEPDSGLVSSDDEAGQRLMQQNLEDRIGQQLIPPVRVPGIVGVWGAEPLRQRIMLFRRFSDHPPWQQFRQDYGARPLFDVLTVGFPAYLADNWLRRVLVLNEDVRQSAWKRAAINYIRLHFQAFACLQRLAIVPAFPWLPSPLFFVPFSSQSPISSTPFPTSLTARSVALWAGRAVLNVAPLAVFYGYTALKDRLMQRLDYALFSLMDEPLNPPLKRPFTRIDPYTGEWRLAGLPSIEMIPPRPQPPPSVPPPNRTRPAVPPPPADSQRLISEPELEESRRNASDDQHREPPANASADPAAASTASSSASSSSSSTSGQQATTAVQQRSPTPTPGPAAARRSNTISSGGGDDGYISEEEEFELSATLISFDVEATDTGEAPPNAWSAELRQSTSASAYDPDAVGRLGGTVAHGTYIRGVYYPGGDASFFSDTMLSRLPTIVHAEGMAELATSLVLVPCEASVVRLLARAYRLRNGLPVDDLYGLGMLPLVPGSAISWNAVNHFAMVVLMQVAVHTAGVVVALSLGWLYRGSQQGWSFFRVVKERLWKRDKRDKGKDTAKA